MLKAERKVTLNNLDMTWAAPQNLDAWGMDLYLGWLTGPGRRIKSPGDLPKDPAEIIDLIQTAFMMGEICERGRRMMEEK